MSMTPADPNAQPQPLSSIDSPQPKSGSILTMGRINRDLLAQLDMPVHALKEAPPRLGAFASEPPFCALLDPNDVDARELCEAALLSWVLSDIPIIAVVSDPWGDEVQDALALGAEDWGPQSEPEELVNKVVAASKAQPQAGVRAGGHVLVADPERERRVRLGRHLRRLGRDVTFAVEGVLTDQPLPALVVAHCQLPGGVVSAWERFRAAVGGDIPWILIGARAELEVVKATVGADPRVELHDESQDLSHVISRASGLLVAERSAQRRSARVPYSTPVRLEGDGISCRWGTCWNIGAGGLYVRTLDPPSRGTTLDLELRPPLGRGRVVVSGTVVWRHPYGGQRAYPSGFGFELGSNMPEADRAGLLAGYRALVG